MPAFHNLVQVVFEMNMGSASSVEELRKQLTVAVESGKLKVIPAKEIEIVNGSVLQSMNFQIRRH